jgi:cysteine desulfurase
MIYLDHAATTPMRPGVWDAMQPYSDDIFGNSSGVHGTSRRAKNALEEARERVAAILGAEPKEIVFTSGGTESDNLALKGSAFNSLPRRGVVTVATEHEAVLETTDFLRRLGFPTDVVGVDEQGAVDLDSLVDSVDADTAVVSIMYLNNETGVIQDMARIVESIREHDPDVVVHSDAVQAFSSQKIDVGALGVDLLTITGHKFGGPKGAGLLYVREGTALEPVLHGGGQELGRRSGTHDVASAVGLGVAMEAAAADRARFRSQVGQIRDDFEKRILAAVNDVVINTPEISRSPQHLNVRFPGVRNETLLLRLDRAGVAASAGSACQSGASEASHVLESMGLSADQARESVRFSFGWNTTPDEAIEASDILLGLIEELG